MFLDSTSRSSHPELFCKTMFLKNSQYSQENTCVWVSFNKIAGLKPLTQLFFCEYCKIFKNSFFYRPPFRRATRGGGGSPPPFFKNHKKSPDFGKKGPDSVHPWVEISIQNVVLILSRRKNSKIFPMRGFFLLKFLTKCLSKCPNTPKPPLPWKVLKKSDCIRQKLLE